MEAMPTAPDIHALKPFDSCVSLGRIVHSHCRQVFTAASDVLAMMDRYGIAEALVHEHHARQIHPRAHANQRLLDAIRDESRLRPVWVIEPPKEPGARAAHALVDAMLAAGVKAARFPMKRVPPLAWLWQDLCAALAEHRVPCFLDFGDVSTRGDMADTDVNGVRDMALAHPDLPLVLSHVMGGLGVHPGVVPLIRRVPNVYIDIAGILEFWRAVACAVSPERVLFATGAPFTDPGILMHNVQYAHELSEADKRLIYGDNLRRLLGAVA